MCIYVYKAHAYIERGNPGIQGLNFMFKKKAVTALYLLMANQTGNF